MKKSARRMQTGLALFFLILTPVVAQRAEDVVVACDTLQTESDTTIAQVRNSAFITSSLYGSLSTSYASSSNWNGQDLRNFALVGNVLYSHNLFAPTQSHSHQLMADLGYLKFVDSTWEKSIDNLQVNLLWNNTGRKFNSSYTVAFSTQFLPASFP